MITLMDVVSRINEAGDSETDRFRRFATRIYNHNVDAYPFYAPDSVCAPSAARLIALIFWMPSTEGWWQEPGRHKFLISMIDAVRILQHNKSWISVSADEVWSAFEALVKVEYPLPDRAFCRPFEVRFPECIIGVDDTWVVTVTVPPGGFSFSEEMEEDRRADI